MLPKSFVQPRSILGEGPAEKKVRKPKAPPTKPEGMSSADWEKKANYAAKKHNTDLKFLMGGEDTSKMSSLVKAWYLAQRQAILQGMITASPSYAPNMSAPNAPTPSSASTSSDLAAFAGETDDNAVSATSQEPIPIDD